MENKNMYTKLSAAAALYIYTLKIIIKLNLENEKKKTLIYLSSVRSQLQVNRRTLQIVCIKISHLYLTIRVWWIY